MGACGYLLILGCLLIDFQNVFSNKFVERNLLRDETSGGGTLLRNPKGRRSVESDEDGELETAFETPKLQFECGDQVFKVSLKPADVDNLLIYECTCKQNLLKLADTIHINTKSSAFIPANKNVHGNLKGLLCLVIIT